MTLEPAVGKGWRAGFGNLLDRELGTWWRTRRCIVHAVLWPGVVAFFALMVWLDQRREWTGAQGLRQSTELFFQLSGIFGLIGAVLVSQGAIVGERRIGTAAWVLTKPTTRSAFVLSKFVGITLSFLLLSLLLPILVWHLQIWAQWRTLPDPAHFLEAAGLIALHQTFYVALTLMLGTIFRHRAAVAGTAIGFWIAGSILPNFVPAWVVALTPWPLINAASPVALWQPIALTIWVPSAATVVLTILCLAVALWRFEREEF
jgi:ABC-2 type transport system permease protein